MADKVTKSLPSGKVMDYEDISFFDNLTWMTTSEAAQYLRISPGALRVMVCRRKILSRRLGSRLRFKKSELDRLLDSSNLGGLR